MDEYRKLFPVAQKYIYLNHAALTPYSINVNAALNFINNDITENGVLHLEEWLGHREETRALMAKLVGAKPENIAFMQNTSECISAIANGIDWKPNQNIVSCDIEFPANIYPWMRLKTAGVELRLAKSQNGRIEVNSLFELVDKDTKIIALSWLQYSSGFRIDLRKIGEFCRKNDILFVVDAIQGLGALQLDVEKDLVDAFAATAYKFLMGPMGIGILYLSERALEFVKPTAVGWTSVKEWWRCFESAHEYKLEYLPSALGFEPGTPDIPGIYALNASLKLILEIGQQKIEEYLLDLCAYLSSKLTELGFEQPLPRNLAESSVLICCRHDKLSIQELETALAKKNIIVSARSGWLRISPHFYNTKDEINKLVDCLAALVK